VEVGEVEHDIVADIFCILHGAEDGVGTTAKHDVERAEVRVAFISPCDEDDEHGRGDLDEKNGGDEADGNAAAARHEEGSGERR